MALHDGHRKRLRQKFLKESHLEDHEILELLLFHTIPRQNTNEIAHRLLDRFGSFRGIMEADMAALQEIEGIGAQSAYFLRLQAEVVARYHLGEVDMNGLLSSQRDLYQYLQSLFVGATNERVYLVLFNGSGRVILSRKISEGLTAVADISPSRITNLAVKHGAVAVLIAHNHPGGIAYPSAQDVEVTDIVLDSLQKVNISLIDHFVVTGDGCCPILHRN